MYEKLLAAAFVGGILLLVLASKKRLAYRWRIAAFTMGTLLLLVAVGYVVLIFLLLLNL